MSDCEHCYECLVKLSLDDVRHPMFRMIVCPECGNKRCPKATHHDNKCTGSNEPGQKGSIYE